MNSSDHGAFCFARCLILNSIALIGICLFRLSVSSCALLGLHCCAGFSLWRAGLLSSHGAQASHCSSCCCRAQALGRAGFNGCGACAQQWLPGSRVRARQLCFMGLAAPWHVRFPLNQGSNSRLLPWQAESYPLSHQGSPNSAF